MPAAAGGRPQRSRGFACLRRCSLRLFAQAGNHGVRNAAHSSRSRSLTSRSAFVAFPPVPRQPAKKPEPLAATYPPQGAQVRVKNSSPECRLTARCCGSRSPSGSPARGGATSGSRCWTDTQLEGRQAPVCLVPTRQFQSRTLVETSDKFNFS